MNSLNLALSSKVCQTIAERMRGWRAAPRKCCVISSSIRIVLRGETLTTPNPDSIHASMRWHNAIARGAVR